MLLLHEQHMNIRQYFTCQGDDKRYNSSRGWLTNSLAIYSSSYQNISEMDLNARLKLGVGSLRCTCLEIMKLEQTSFMFAREGEKERCHKRMIIPS